MSGEGQRAGAAQDAPASGGSPSSRPAQPPANQPEMGPGPEPIGPSSAPIKRTTALHEEPSAADVSISVVVTTRNERPTIRHLLDSLVHQDVREVVVVDAMSNDGTMEVLARYEGLLPLTVISTPCTRGEGRNIGAATATGDLLAFIDGDCIANARWLDSLRDAWDGKSVLAGRTILTGYWAFTKLHRVELPHRGSDTTWPSCNLAYPRNVFEQLGGFDPAFVTAEDIDLNYRAIELGTPLEYVADAIVYARARESISGFVRQAYWNGYGRKQLTVKHGRLWHEYDLGRMLRTNGGSVWGLMRMGGGFFGYLAAKRRHGRHPNGMNPASNLPD